MSLGPEKIILILVVALVVFGPQRLPEIARQVGAMMRELRRMQDTVRDELENVMHPDFSPGEVPSNGIASNGVATNGVTTHGVVGNGPGEDMNHAALPAGALGAGPDMQPYEEDPSSRAAHAEESQPHDPYENVTDDGFSGPRSFS